MKRYKILIIFISVLFFGGCSDYLDRQPLDQISSSTFWQSKGDFEMALTAIYGINTTGASWDNYPGGVWAYHLPNWDNLTDNSFGQHNYFNTKNIVAGDITSTTGGYQSVVYSLSYQAIARINIFLGQLGQYEGSDMSDAEKKIAEAEVRFFRAYYYFQLYCTYGDVPLVLEPLTLENQLQAKVSEDKIYEQVLTDLDYAIANLNTVPYYVNTGHVAQSTAQALKARVLIYEAYGSTGVPDNNLLGQVRDLCLDIMPKYELSPVFEDLFQDKGQSGNKEIIYAVNYLAPDNVPAYGTDLIYGDWIIVSPLQSFIDAFECSDGLPWGVSPLTDEDNPFENRDPRLNKTVFVDHPDWGDGNIHFPTNSRPTGYGLKKFLCPENTPIGYSTLSQQNSVVLRLGEVLLMYAEAQNEIAGPDASVYQAMEDLRARVDMPPYPAGLSKEEMRERIRHERRIELAFEGLRYFDLKRWHIAGDVLNNVTDGLVEYNWEDRFYHWPLPQSEIDKSQGVLIQNPDYQ
ncbi:RagB/SusD family nutrient uptake outer membrane protein [Gaoshiqia sediminis]|uniref:RagB/SusD family nutrient uptake outer membrane protein n=1 Tax=Gaoshiqia sediminis TaxID=2986998 RepID=A0AA42CA71_9BACT|nr:RagB/SusD family nutrient uptake outer membrane protein [Gaoshiqia sediminis]MCW0483110.1 RagB/SusD family nutrient uptake outer membrane protein [Gaoshiqia sediminis]